MSRAHAGKLVPGLIVRAEVADSAGRNPKVRPLVLLSGEDDTPADQPLIAVAISSTLPTPLPDHYVLLPWTHAGHPQTGLKKKCAAVCNWLPKVSRSASLQVMGRVPDANFVAHLLGGPGERIPVRPVGSIRKTKEPSGRHSCR